MIMRTLTKAITKKLLILFLLIIVVSTIVIWRQKNPADSTNVTSPSSGQSSSSSSKTQTNESFIKSQYSVNDPSSLWVVVNKGRVLPVDYVPANLSENMQLRPESATALENLESGAAKDGLKIVLVSGYRSYATQKSVYASYSASQGQAAADTFSARAGHSEHQTGLAADVGASSGKCQLDKCFGETSEGKWLAVNAYKYGFIIRYQKDKQNLTGYDYEPWHLRYAGIDLATQIHTSEQTLEQFFDLPAFSDYPSTSYELKTGF